MENYKWIEAPFLNVENNPITLCKCTACKTTCIKNIFDSYNFCPHCGAKMGKFLCRGINMKDGAIVGCVTGEKWTEKECKSCEVLDCRYRDYLEGEVLSDD